MKYTKEILTEATKQSISFAGVLRYLGLKQAGGTQSHIKRMILKYNIDITHFTGLAHNKGQLARNRKTAEEILIKHDDDYRQKTIKLIRSLKEIGREYKCEKCDNDGTWNGERITLHVDHIDGNCQNDEKENLRFLCPNCHSQTSTYGNKKRKCSIGKGS